MAALSADKVVNMKVLEGTEHDYPMGVDIIYKGGLVAIDADGYACPAADTMGLRVVGIADEKVDNSAGSAGDKDVRVRQGCLAKLVATSITQAMLGQIMYVADDQTFDAASTNLVPAGILVDYVSATSGWILVSPLVHHQSDQRRPFHTDTANATLTVEESGGVFASARDGMGWTLPGTQMGVIYTFVNVGADAAAKVSVSPAAADAIMYITSTDDKDVINTKASAIEGDMITLMGDGGQGWIVLAVKGTWAKE